MPAAETDARVSEVLDILAKESGIARERLTPEARIDELGIASIDMVQTVFEIESRFGIELPVVSEGAGAEFATVGDLTRHVLATVERGGAAAAEGHPS